MTADLSIESEKKLNPTYKSILALAMPIIVGGLADNIGTAINTAFVGRLGEVAIDSVGLGGLFYYNWVILAMGLSMGIQIIAGRRNGEDQFEEAGLVLKNGIFLMLGLSILILGIFIGFRTSILEQIISNRQILAATDGYIAIKQWGIPFVLFYIAIRAFFIGVTETKSLLIITLIEAGINILGDYSLIYGNFGCPKLGVNGAAYASLIAESSGAVLYIGFLLGNKSFKKFNVFRYGRIQLETLAHILKTGVPLMIQGWISYSGWFVFFLVIEKIGQSDLAASSIIKNIYLIYMIPMWGFATASNTLTTNLIGDNNYGKVIPTTRKIIKLSTLIMLIFVTPTFLFPQFFIELFNQSPLVVQAAIIPLRIVCIALLMFPAAYVMLNVVSGSGDSRYSLIIEVSVTIAYVAYILISARVFHWEMWKIWFAEWIYMFILIVLSYLRIKTGKWRTFEV